MSDRFQDPTNYPPTDIEAGEEFHAPGPVSRAVSDYLAMCAPRQRRGSLVLRAADRGELLAAAGVFN
jgi:hypothetical protein